MHTKVATNTNNNFATLKEVLKQHSLHTLTQDEVTFLQLHCLERLEVVEIAKITDKETISVYAIAQKFLLYAD